MVAPVSGNRVLLPQRDAAPREARNALWAAPIPQRRFRRIAYVRRDGYRSAGGFVAGEGPTRSQPFARRLTQARRVHGALSCAGSLESSGSLGLDADCSQGLGRRVQWPSYSWRRECFPRRDCLDGVVALSRVSVGAPQQQCHQGLYGHCDLHN